MKRFIQSVLVLGLIALFTGCSVTNGSMGHVAQTQVQLSKANFDIVKSVEGEASASYFLGIGLSKENLVARAKKDMLKKANLHGSQALVNITTDSKGTFYPFFRKKTIYISADVVEFK
ncbi:MAG TPA: hypothetical protein EYO75_06230 [Sulfurimonas sp.]|nr:hypothetical protein [Sulfurimonas sp.]HIM76115.1 hypothetical protein [Campylobacterales bacterium]